MEPGRLLQPLAPHASQGREALRQVRPGLWRLLQGRGDGGRLHQGDPGRLAAQDPGKRAHARAKGRHREDGLGRVDGDAEEAPRRTKGTPRRRQQVDRTGRDLPDTIRSTAANAGYLDIKMVPERHNNVKVLLLMDVGGTMDEHIQRVEELFSAVKSEFKHLEFYYFHNCVYDFMWKNNRRRFAEKFPTLDIIRKYNKDYKLIFVGDATMSPYEILQPGGSVEYNNEEAGAEWIQRLTHAFPKFAWINPEPQGVWQYRQSISIIQQLVSNRMYPLSLKGLEETMRLLSK